MSKTTPNTPVKSASVSSLLSPAKPTLYHSPRSRSTRVVWLLEEIGQDAWKDSLDIKMISVSKGENRRPEYLKLSPNGKVPAYIEGPDFILLESGAIMNHLIRKFGKERDFMPNVATDAKLFAKYESWFLFTVGHLDPTLVPTLSHIHHTPKDKQDSIMIAHKRREFDEVCIPPIELALKESGYTYILGPKFTAADIFVVYSLRMAKILGWLETHTMVLSYFNKLSARAAYLKVFY